MFDSFNECNSDFCFIFSPYIYIHQSTCHVFPEWYFLPFYAILGSIPYKTAGVLSMFGSILVLFIIPFTNTSLVRNTTYQPILEYFFGLLLVLSVFLLGLVKNLLERLLFLQD